MYNFRSKETRNILHIYLFCFSQSFPVWLGGLLNPEAYITATRQCVAQANSWPLEELHLDVTITDSNDTAAIPGDCFAVVGKLIVNMLKSTKVTIMNGKGFVRNFGRNCFQDLGTFRIEKENRLEFRGAIIVTVIT